MKIPFTAFLLTTCMFMPVHAESPNKLPEEATKILRVPQSAIFYSLEPWEEAKPGEKTLHHFKILGQTNLDPQKESSVAGAFEKAIADWDGMIAACFDPRHALRVTSEKHVYDFLLCYNCHQLYVYKDDKLLGSVGAAGSPKYLNGLLTAANVPISQTDTEEQQEAARKKHENEDAHWLKAMPPFAQPFWKTMREEDPFEVAPLRQPLRHDFPRTQDQILVLLAWYGNGAGPWSGYSSYENVPEQLLLDYPTKEILSALRSKTLTNAQLEGAARFLAGWEFSRARPKDRKLIPEDLKKTLLEHTVKTGNENNISRARKALK